MKILVPNYYENFSCIANKCKHNCCIGWEIDIDEDTYEYYQNIKSDFGKRFENDVITNDDCACFRLDGKGRCAFLNENNLCEIILNLGEDALCQICTDHPRYRNYYENATEIGLGLCCEEAGRIILGQKEKFELIISNEISDDDYDEEFLKQKQEILFDIQNDDHSLKEKIIALLNKNKTEIIKRDFQYWVDNYISFERLDESWTNLLNDMKNVDFDSIFIPEKFEKVFEKMLLYFVYRHLNEMDKNIIKFSIFSVFFISQICKYHISKYGKLHFEDVVEYARMYSSEIEYSDENIEKIIERL
ncbi:MAG: flagellin lysine-N-methylase [Clostridia bacterium]|nr:flagellin lysine-N-methylase [Clostridia bacterium]